jgi:NAD-dependent SIR2 family protein deacetylase
MGYIFRIECSDCGENMRFDRKKFENDNIMLWTCWTCEGEVETIDLRTTVKNYKWTFIGMGDAE